MGVSIIPTEGELTRVHISLLIGHGDVRLISLPLVLQQLLLLPP